MTNRAKEIYEAAVRYQGKYGTNHCDMAKDFVWLAQCTDEERREALRMLDDRAAGRST